MKFQFIINRADKLLKVVDEKKKMHTEMMNKARQEKKQQQLQKQKDRPALTLIDTVPDDVTIFSDEEESMAKKDAVDKVFNAPKKNNNERASKEGMEKKAKSRAPNQNKSKTFAERFAMKGKQGSGLFECSTAMQFVKKRTTESHWWCWTPALMPDNTLSKYGEITCMCCSFSPMYLKNISNHLKSPSHRKAVEEHSKRKSSEKSRPFLQARVDKKVICARKIS